MAFDGITIHALVKELNDTLLNGRIDKIAQPERDELILTVKSPGGQFRLLLSVNASLPLAYLTSKNKPSPLTAPSFCMLLRKHINNGRIIAITQPGLERIIDITIEHLDEMGDYGTKHLIVELMGKHSNIIFTDSNNRIIDSIKRINAGISSVREVLPGYDYFIPNTMEKHDALTTTREEIATILAPINLPCSKAIYTSFTGISPTVAEEICSEAGIESRIPASELTDSERIHLANVFANYIGDVINHQYSPSIITSSNMLEKYYAEKNIADRIRQRSADLRQIVNTALERNYKKYDLQDKQLKDTEKRDTYRIYGELLSAYAYAIPEASKEYEALNYYTNEQVIIPLDPDLSAIDNSKRYFAKYNKLKRTYEALNEQIVFTKAEIDHLESISTALDIARDYDDLTQIKEELSEFGFIRKNTSGKGGRTKAKSKPLHYVSSDGYDIFVGKNNIQNEELTFKIATGNDWWFHAKDMPGSHVIVKSGTTELPDRTFEEAAALAAYYSKGRAHEKVEVDYIMRKHLKKVNGGAPGFVIYHTNYSMNISPDISNIKEI
jgi:predicted ribosome quality control (RQC) complex YloA/Tae2 family protein